jgi:hypothetical protein
MPRPLTALLSILAVLVVLLSGKAAASPPERPLDRMVLDQVADGLRRYARRDGRGDERRVEWLKKVAPAKDPRVVIALAELVFDGQTLAVRDEAALVLWKHHIRRAGATGLMPSGAAALEALRSRIRDWWSVQGEGYRLAAKQLP